MLPTLPAHLEVAGSRFCSAGSSLTTCPTPELLKNGYWSYKFVATPAKNATAPAASALATTVTLAGDGDPGYHFTGAGLAEVALCLADKSSVACRGSGPGGVFSPGVAVNTSAFTERLQEVGLMRVSVSTGVAEVPERAEEQHDMTLVPSWTRVGVQNRRGGMIDAALAAVQAAASA